MSIDTRGFTEKHVGHRLSVKLNDGETIGIQLLELTVCDPPEPCCGITYRLLSTERVKDSRQLGEVYWTPFSDVREFDVAHVEQCTAMALNPARRYSNSAKWLVSLFLIAIIWRFGIYGVDWKSRNSVMALLVAIAVLAFCITFWKRKN